MSLEARADYIAASTNRYPHASDASKNSVIAFGSNKLVALWDAKDPLDRGVYETLPGHDGLITGVRFVREDHFMTADDKGVIRSWRHDGSKWETVAVKQAHDRAISALAVLDATLVTGASDSCIKVWQTDTLQEVQSIHLRGRYALSLALCILPGTQSMLLAIGTTERNVQIWTRSGTQFLQSANLSGHEDWVRSLAFRQPDRDGDSLLLASGSQDATIRLWNIEPYKTTNTITQPTSGPQDDHTDDLLDAFEASLEDLADAEEGGRQISLKRHILSVKGSDGSQQQFTITFDALLIGHEAGVTSLSWRPPQATDLTPTLLSTSTDSSLIMWSPSTVITQTQDGSTSIWINRQRFGDVGGQRLGGFVGGLWTRNGAEAAAWGWAGGWRRWGLGFESPCLLNGSLENWVEVGAISGHSAPVKGLSWSPGGEYLLSASLDQTTRMHGAIPSVDDQGIQKHTWHEIGRPQVHGYDLVGVTSLNPLRFVSIADEKVARVFEAPREFIDTVNNLGVAQLAVEGERPRAATVPPLGLSNKAVDEAVTASPMSDITRMKRRPFEGELASFTLWPEVEKIFGHGYESISLAVSKSKKFVATACKATSPEHAVVRIYDTEKWQPVGQPLTGHTLTVTGIAFSPDDRFVLSVSRDRSWRLFESKDEHGYLPVAADKSHTRIIWDCAWAEEGDLFATASRDKTVKIWKSQLEKSDHWAAVSTIKTAEAATAVTFAPTSDPTRRMIVVGLETGRIVVYSCAHTCLSDWQLDLSIDSRTAHVDHIYHLACRPSSDRAVLQLASCSEDNTVKILTVRTAKS